MPGASAWVSKLTAPPEADQSYFTVLSFAMTSLISAPSPGARVSVVTSELGSDASLAVLSGLPASTVCGASASADTLASSAAASSASCCFISRSERHTSELPHLMGQQYAALCFQK